MPAHHRPWRVSTVVVSAGLVLATLIAGPTYAVDYPSWDDVQNARQNQEATAATAAEIEGLLVSLENEAAKLGRVAQIKGESYNVAREALDAATSTLARLDAQAQDAAARAERSGRRAGQIIAQLARSGGGNLSVTLVLSPQADDLLGSLASMTRLTAQSAHLLAEANQDRNVATALKAQATTAQAARTSLADDAKAAFDDVSDASRVVAAKIADQQEAADQLYAQLAALKGSTTDLERQYIEGKTATRPTPGGPAAPTAPTTPAAPTVPTQPTPGTLPPLVTPPVVRPPVLTPPVVAPPVVTPPVVTPPVETPPAVQAPAPAPVPSPSTVEAAIAFATAQLGDRYQYGGYGPNDWDCSGLTKASYAAAGVYIGAHGSTSQYRYLGGQGRLVPIGQIQRGDLIFYSEDSSYVYHAAIYIGGGRMIEAQYEGVPVKIAPVRSYDLMSYVGRPA